MGLPEQVGLRLTLFALVVGVITGGLLLGGVALSETAASPAGGVITDTTSSEAATDSVAQPAETASTNPATTADTATTDAAEPTDKATTDDPYKVDAERPEPAANTSHALSALRVDEVWTAFDTRGEGTTIAVLDSGVAVDNHPSLAPTEDGWADFVGNSSEPLDERNHGTIAAGVAADNQSAAGDRYGVAPEAEMIHARVTDDRGNARTSKVVQGIRWAIDHPQEPDVLLINVAHDGVHYDSYIDAVETAREAGIAVVVPVGNNGDGETASPASVYSALSVGAVDTDGRVAAYSSGSVVETRPTWGPTPIYQHNWPESYITPTVVAPGTATAAAADGGYRQFNGTSLAAPHVAGTVALMQAASDRQLSPAEIDRALLASARHPTVSPDSRYGYGTVDAYAAVSAVADKPPYFGVSRLAHNESVAPGEPISFDAHITNTGNASDRQLVTVSVDGSRVGARPVQLNESETVSLRGSWNVSCVAPRESSITITTDNTSVTKPVEVCAS